MISQQPQQHRAPRKSRTGQATVELAIVISFLALLLVGVADVARIYSEHLAVVHAAGVGARWLTLDPNYKACSGYTSFQTPVVEDLTSSVRSANIVAINDWAGLNPAAVRVDITYTHDYLFGLIQGVPSRFTGNATMPGTVLTGTGACPIPPPSATPTNTPLPPTATNTPLPPTWTPTATRTRTPVPPTSTRTPTATPTPVCPYSLSVQSYHVNGNRPVTLRITLTDAQGAPVAGAHIRVTISGPGGETLNGMTDVTGFVC